ncbi:hypothetical protein HanIR_Chr11g0546091 [Helianthus annuus]|nr:hypothetical protein HanIR_Chr11g0546091 [Helianthus annuus]
MCCSNGIIRLYRVVHLQRTLGILHCRLTMLNACLFYQISYSFVF